MTKNTKSKSKTKTSAKPTAKKAANTSGTSNRSKAAASSKPKAQETVAKKAPKVEATPALSRSTYLTIHNLRQWIADEFERATSEQPTLAQFEVLNAIASADGPSQTFICRKTGMDRSTVAEVTRRLVTRGFATRQRTQQDERAYAVSLTAEGRKMHTLGVEVMEKLEEKLHSVQGFQSAINWATKVLDTYGMPVANPTVGGGAQAGSVKGNDDGGSTKRTTQVKAHSDDFDDDDDIDTGADAGDERVAA